jgi:hypothetical protein
MIKICRTCGDDFDTEHKKTLTRSGFIDECAKCSVRSKDASVKYLGKQGATHKGANIEIFRENLAWVKNVIKGENARGFTANISLGSPVNQSIDKEDSDFEFGNKESMPVGYNKRK